MGDKSDPNRRHETRADGRLEFSPQGRAIAERRLTAEKGGRLERLLGPKSQFSSAFRSAFKPESEHEQILGRINLRKELEAASKTITALKSAPADEEAQHVLADMMDNPFQRKTDCVLCPIWRHERETYLTLVARNRYVFPSVIDQLYMVTIVFDFAEDLYRLGEALIDAKTGLRQAAAHMGRKGFGVMMVGSFELDLLSPDQLRTEFKSRALLAELGRSVPDGGGWAVTGHFFVRVPHVDVFKNWLKSRYPSSTDRWIRVQFDPVHRDKSLLENLSRVLSYGGKMPKPLFEAPTRKTVNDGRSLANFNVQKMLTSFYGQRIPNGLDEEAFGIDAAIVQWAKFMHRAGPGLTYYSVESTHAQKWLSASETAYVRSTDIDMDRTGRHPVELRRDHSIHPPHQMLNELDGRKINIRSRPLKHDPKWEVMTDCSNIDSEVERPDFLRWFLKS